MTKYYKHPKFGHVYGELIATPVGRLVWPSLIAPRTSNYEGADITKYEVTVALDKSDPQTDVFLDKLDGMIAGADGMLALFNHKAAAKISLDSLIKDGDEFNLEKYPYYAGKYVLKATNKEAVPVKDKFKATIDPSVIIGGVIGRLVVTPLLTARGLSFRLERVQFIEDDDTRIGGSVRGDVDSFLTDLDEPTEADEVLEETEVEEEVEVEEKPKATVRSRPLVAQSPSQAMKQGRPANVAAATVAAPANGAPKVTAAELRARAAATAKSQQATVSKTGKGKSLALNNL